MTTPKPPKRVWLVYEEVGPDGAWRSVRYWTPEKAGRLLGDEGPPLCSRTRATVEERSRPMSTIRTCPACGRKFLDGKRALVPGQLGRLSRKLVCRKCAAGAERIVVSPTASACVELKCQEAASVCAEHHRRALAERTRGALLEAVARVRSYPRPLTRSRSRNPATLKRVASTPRASRPVLPRRSRRWSGASRDFPSTPYPSACVNFCARRRTVDRARDPVVASSLRRRIKTGPRAPRNAVGQVQPFQEDEHAHRTSKEARESRSGRPRPRDRPCSLHARLGPAMFRDSRQGSCLSRAPT
jgi:hypothetical protein